MSQNSRHFHNICLNHHKKKKKPQRQQIIRQNTAQAFENNHKSDEPGWTYHITHFFETRVDTASHINVFSLPRRVTHDARSPSLVLTNAIASHARHRKKKMTEQATLHQQCNTRVWYKQQLHSSSSLGSQPRLAVRDSLRTQRMSELQKNYICNQKKKTKKETRACCSRGERREPAVDIYE